MSTFEEYLSESTFGPEYHPVLKKHFFKKQPPDAHKHPLHGVVKINQHGHWEHTHPSGGKFEGTTGASLDKHLARVRENE